MSDGKKAHTAIRGAVFTQQIGYHERKAIGSLRRLVSMANLMGLDVTRYAAAIIALESPYAPPATSKPVSLEGANARARARAWAGKAVPPKRPKGTQ